MRLHPYRGKVAALATMHQKEIAIAPPLRQIVGLEVITTAEVDTDALGTFAGDIPRIGSMGEVATRKARLGMAATSTQIGLASEGTFGPHLKIPFMTAGIELLKLVDDDRGIEISESLVTSQIVFQSTTTRPGAELDEFLASSHFPTHGMIARPNKAENSKAIIKDILNLNDLICAIATLARQSNDGMVTLSNDMRAHRNPTRMLCLSDLARKLAERIANLCPICKCPGFGRRGYVAGLPCSACGSPTQSSKADTFSCVACKYHKTRLRPDGKTHESPMYCDYCNQ